MLMHMLAFTSASPPQWSKRALIRWLLMQVLYLAKYVSAVYIVHRKDHFTASRIMQRRVLEHPKVKVSDELLQLA